jgi:hypothetical protein
MQPRRLLTSSSPGQNLCRITAAYPANDLLRPLPPQGRGLFFSNYRDTNGAVNVYGLCGFSTHWPGGHCQGTPSLTLTLYIFPALFGATTINGNRKGDYIAFLGQKSWAPTAMIKDNVIPIAYIYHIMYKHRL